MKAKPAAKYRGTTKPRRKVQINVLIPVRVDRQLARMTWDEKRSPSDLVTHILEEYFSRNGNR